MRSRSGIAVVLACLATCTAGMIAIAAADDQPSGTGRRPTAPPTTPPASPPTNPDEGAGCWTQFLLDLHDCTIKFPTDTFLMRVCFEGAKGKMLICCEKKIRPSIPAPKIPGGSGTPPGGGGSPNAVIFGDDGQPAVVTQAGLSTLTVRSASGYWPVLYAIVNDEAVEMPRLTLTGENEYSIVIQPGDPLIQPGDVSQAEDGSWSGSQLFVVRFIFTAGGRDQTVDATAVLVDVRL